MSDELLEEALKPAYFKDDEPVDTSNQNIYQTYSTDFGGPIDFDAIATHNPSPLDLVYKKPVPVADRLGEASGLTWPYTYSGGEGKVEEGPSFLESTAEGLGAVKKAIVSGAKTAGDITVGAVEEAAGYAKSNPIDAALIALSMIPQARAARWGGKALSYAPRLAKNIGFLQKSKYAAPIINKTKSAAKLGRTGIQVNLLADAVNDFYQHGLMFNPEEDLWDYLYRSDKDIQSAFYNTGYDFNTSDEQLDRTWDLLNYAHEKHGISIPMIYTEGSDKNEPFRKKWTNPTYAAGFLGRAGNIHVLEGYESGGKSVDYNRQVLTEYLHHIRNETGGIFANIERTYDSAAGLGLVTYLKTLPDSELEQYNARRDSDGDIMEKYKLDEEGNFQYTKFGDKVRSHDHYSHSNSIKSEERIHGLYEDKLLEIAKIENKTEREAAFDTFLEEMKEGVGKERAIRYGQFIPTGSEEVTKKLRDNIMKTLKEYYPTY